MSEGILKQQKAGYIVNPDLGGKTTPFCKIYLYNYGYSLMTTGQSLAHRVLHYLIGIAENWYKQEAGGLCFCSTKRKMFLIHHIDFCYENKENICSEMQWSCTFYLIPILLI